MAVCALNDAAPSLWRRLQTETPLSSGTRNTRCSSTCAMPTLPAGSSTAPTSTITTTPAIVETSSCSTTTRSPLGSVNSWTGNACAGGGGLLVPQVRLAAAASARTNRRRPAIAIDRLLDRQELDVEDQHPLGRARPRRVVVGQVAGDPEAGLLADHHQLHALCPSRDHAVERERRGHAARDRAVEHLSVGGPAGVVHLDHALGLRVVLAGPFLENAVGDPGLRLLGVLGRRGD